MSNSTDKTDPASLVAADAGAGRRRLLRGGLAAAPVLLTLISRPVLGQLCVSPSAFCSGNLSAPGGMACRGRMPSYWAQSQHFGQWRAEYDINSLFDHVFTAHYPGKTLLNVLNLGGGNPNDVAQYIVAALLNVEKGWAPVLTIKLVQQMWSEYITLGYFSPQSGVKWYHDQLITYLRTTMA